MAIAVAGIALAWWAGKSKDDSPASLPEIEAEEIIEAVAELLPYKGDICPPSGKANVLSNISRAINKTGATGMKDLEIVVAEFDKSDAQDAAFNRKVSIVLLAQEYLEWLENNPQPSSPALTYTPDSKDESGAPRQSSAVPIIEIDNVLANVRAWKKSQKHISPHLLESSAGECGCMRGDGTPKTPFLKEKAERIAQKFNQRMYPCPHKEGHYHLASK